MINVILTNLLVFAARKLVKRSTNTIDDKLVDAVVLAVENKDYGLQRKPTGPRKNRRTPGNGKTKKA